jgi:hypothetical protein
VRLSGLIRPGVDLPQCTFRETRPAGSGSPCGRRQTRLQVRSEPRRGVAVLAGERRASEPVAPQQVFVLQDERDTHTQEGPRTTAHPLGPMGLGCARSPSPQSCRSRRAPLRSPYRSSPARAGASPCPRSSRKPALPPDPRSPHRPGSPRRFEFFAFASTFMAPSVRTGRRAFCLAPRDANR